jgi:Flp pilus assembly protein TadG
VPEVDVALGAFRPRRRTERGAAALEFALVLPILLVLVFGLIQYGLYFWAYQGGADAARQAARTSAVGSLATCDELSTNIDDAIGNLATDTPEITRTYEPGESNAGTDVQAGDFVTVSVSYRTIDLHFPFVPFINNGEVTQTAEARVEYTETQPEEC